MTTAMREMIMASDTAGRENALAKLLPMQRRDFEELFTIWEICRSRCDFDLPLHEFLPHSADDLAEVAAAAGVTIETARQRAIVERDQPDAWPSRLSSCRDLSRNLP